MAERSVELLPFSHSSSCGLRRFAMLAASVAWRQSAPPSERTVAKEKERQRRRGRANRTRKGQVISDRGQMRCERTMTLWESDCDQRRVRDKRASGHPGTRAGGGREGGLLTLSASRRLNVFPHPWQTFDCDLDVWSA